MSKKLPAVHPGEILLHDYLKPMGISQYRLAKEIDVPAQRIGQIVAGRRSITADTAKDAMGDELEQNRRWPSEASHA